jgi:iron complex outermembrane receptor protein
MRLAGLRPNMMVGAASGQSLEIGGNDMRHIWQHRINRSVCAALLGGTAMIVFTAPAMAQDTPVPTGASSTPNETMESDGDIIVRAPNYVPSGSMSATKSDAPLIETPQSISVISRDQIDLLSFVDVQQAVRYTSGIVGENYGPDLRFDFLTLRGFSPIQYIDGLQAPISSTIPNVGVDLYGFEGIDILKGPSSVLYGTTPPGGIYNLTSRRPSSEFGGEIGVRYGTDDYKQVNGTITGGLGSGISARLTGLYRDRDSQVDFVKANRVFIAPTVKVVLPWGTEITALGYYQHERVEGDTNGFLPAVGTLYANPLGRVGVGTNLGEPDYNFYERDQYGVGYQLVQPIVAGVRFEQNVKWFDYSELQHVIYGAGLGADNRTVSRYNFPYKEDVQEFAADNRLQADFDTGSIRHRVTAGVDYRNFRNASFFGFAVAPSIDLFAPVYNSVPFVTPTFFPYTSAKREQTGVYLQDQIKAGGLVVTLAGRQDWLDTVDRASGTRTKDDKFTYRVGVNYVTGIGIAPYASYATSFVPVAGRDRLGNLFIPSTGTQFEAGVKYEHGKRGDPVRIFATIAGFSINQNNIATLDTSAGAGPFDQVQLGKVRVNGIEVEGVARIRDQISINGSYTYLDAKVTGSSVPAEIGLRLVTTPRHKLSLLVDYTIQQGSLGGLGFGIGGRYLSSNFGDHANVYRMPGTTLFDALIHYDLPDWRFSINGSNIFDEIYVGRCSGPVGCIYGQRAQVIGSVTRKF